ncbi:HB2J protein, partial [Aegithalos caudatus]|nr:HB2J protein [Aegithalos caudatus]
TPDLCHAHPGLFQMMFKAECHFTNGTEKVRFMDRYFYNRVEFVRFDSDVGEFVGYTALGEKWARYWNSNPDIMENERTAVDMYCRHNYEGFTPFLVDR